MIVSVDKTRLFYKLARCLRVVPESPGWPQCRNLAETGHRGTNGVKHDRELCQWSKCRVLRLTPK